MLMRKSLSKWMIQSNHHHQYHLCHHHHHRVTQQHNNKMKNMINQFTHRSYASSSIPTNVHTTTTTTTTSNTSSSNTSINTSINAPISPTKLIVLVGPPASGKGTHSRLLAEHYPEYIKIVSAEDTLREAAKNSEELNQLLKRGDMAPGELTDQLLQQKIVQEDSIEDSKKRVIILEGYPRDVEQAKLFLAWFSDKKLSLRKSQVFILHLLGDREHIMKRLQGRLIHPKSGRPYHIDYNPPKMDTLDDITGEPLIRREDDQDKNAILKRLTLYKEQTLHMIDFLAEHEFHVIDIAQGDSGIAEINAKIEQTLQEKDLLPKPSPSSSSSSAKEEEKEEQQEKN